MIMGGDKLSSVEDFHRLARLCLTVKTSEINNLTLYNLKVLRD